MFLVLSGVLFYYAFTSGFEFLQAADPNTAFQWLRVAAFWYLLPVVVFHSCVVYANVRVSRRILLPIYGSAVLFSILEALAAPYEVYKVPWGWDYHYTGYFGNLQVFWVIVPTIASLLVLLRRYHTVKSHEEKTGVAFVSLGVLVPVVTGIVVTAIPYLISVNLPDLTPPAAALGFVLIGYAVFRYGIQVLTTSAAAGDILSTMVDALFLVDSEGKIVVSNKAASRLLGFETRELSGRPLNTITEDSGSPGFLLASEFPVNLETDFKTKQGSLIPVSISRSAVFNKRGNLAGYVFICRDISERKQMERRLAETQRLAAIGETATMVGHDLRNPLQAMATTLHLAKTLMASENEGQRKEAGHLLNELGDTVRYMNKIVSDLQDFARPVHADPVEVNLLDLVRATVAEANVPGGVEVDVNISGASGNVKLDPLLFERVLTNLILNAVQAMPDGGKLTITGNVDQESVTMVVQDTGVGIEPDNLGKIFTPFFTTKAKGQGLGLAVCKRLTDAQGGTIDVTSQVGKGSTFTLRMPVKRNLD